MDSSQIHQKVQERYSLAAKTTVGAKEEQIAKAFGYSTADLASIPSEANLGVSCGNPGAIARLIEGETVIDFGCGAGFDIFIAAKKVGERGRAIGVDQNADMLEKANRNKHTAKATNVDFVQSPITKVALPDEIADCILSNCVINLVPEAEKALVFQEAFRLLKPGGRVAVSDILAKRELPEHIKQDVALYVGCIAGASQVQQYDRWLRDAGFTNLAIVDAAKDLNVYNSSSDRSSLPGNAEVAEQSKCCANRCPHVTRVEVSEKKREIPCYKSCCSDDISIDLNEWTGSYSISATKPDAVNTVAPTKLTSGVGA